MRNWFLIRPDAAIALEDPVIRRNLRRYISILERKTLPKFLLAKCFEAEIKDESDLDLVLKDFHNFVKKYDKEKFEIKFVKNNLLSELHNFSLKLLSNCAFCEHKCGVNRVKGERGRCGVGKVPKISSIFVHHGEEPWITPSLTIFFAGCNFKCVYCQNYDISQNPENGEIFSTLEITTKINKLACSVRNINFVGGDPTPNVHYVLDILNNLDVNLPIIWNSNAYESEVCSKILACFVDVYLYDFKYGNDRCAMRLSKVERYFETVTRNIKFASRFGELSLRHLVLPNHTKCCSENILKWISRNLRDRYVIQLMNQYRPDYLARRYPEINRKLFVDEFEEVVKLAEKLNLHYFSQ
jgi:putative pyruvate formate lyase activating enzyme